MDQLRGEWPIAKQFLIQQFEELAAQISTGWNINHNSDGTHNFPKINAGRQLLTRDVLANVPTTLGPTDQGYLFYITDYNHIVYWTGSVWTFAPGDVGNGFIRDYVIPPQENGWQLCDGSATTTLIVGGTALTTSPGTTPNLTGTPAYRKSAAAYTGTIVAAGGSTATGTTGTGTTGTGTTGTGVTGGPNATVGPFTIGGVTSLATIDHTHTIPGLSVPGLSVPGLSVPALGVGSVDMAHLNVLPYYRR